MFWHGLFIYLHGSRVEPHPIDASRDYKQYGVETGAASINKNACLVEKMTNT